MVLWDKECVTVGQLGEILYLDAGTLTGFSAEQGRELYRLLYDFLKE